MCITPVVDANKSGFKLGFPTRTVATLPFADSTICGKPVDDLKNIPYSSVSNNGTS